jgi:chromosome segregation ATPase
MLPRVLSVEGLVIELEMRSEQVLVKRELLDGLNRAAALQMELARTLDKRDTFTADITTLTAQIAELEGRLSAVEKAIASLKEAELRSVLEQAH